MISIINKLKTALEHPLPGEEAQYLMAPFHRKKIEDALLSMDNFKPSAVMLALCFENDNSAYIPLIERVSYNGAHSAQISLPGGKYDDIDESLQNTALRECFEEIGLNEIEVLGSLTQIKIPVSNFLVQPYIGICKINEPNLILDRREVKSILKLRLHDLLKDELIQIGTVKLNTGQEIKTAWFEVEGHQVWGATAMILSELKQLLKSIS